MRRRLGKLANGWLFLAPGQNLAVLAAASLMSGPTRAAGSYSWLPTAKPAKTIESTISAPPGFLRGPVDENSFAAWLKALPAKPTGSPVLLFNGTEKSRQDVHAAVVDIDVGNRDLQ